MRTPVQERLPVEDWSGAAKALTAGLPRTGLPLAVEEAAVDRRGTAEKLVAVTGGRREAIERIRWCFLERLHRASDDFEATEGLRRAEAALALTLRPVGLWAWQARERQHHGRRWWQRRSARWAPC
jgi:hypothetical protein